MFDKSFGRGDWTNNSMGPLLSYLVWHLWGRISCPLRLLIPQNGGIEDYYESHPMGLSKGRQNAHICFNCWQKCPYFFFHFADWIIRKLFAVFNANFFSRWLVQVGKPNLESKNNRLCFVFILFFPNSVQLLWIIGSSLPEKSKM